MFVLFSHIAAFCALFAGAISDLKTTEVPDSFNIVGVLAGVALHFAASYPTMDFGTLLSFAVFTQPMQWLSALGEPLLWSLGVGAVFSLYGWGLYFLGMWGGADAFAMSVLGFAAPYAVSGPSLLYPISLFVAVLLAGFAYTLLFGVWKSLKNPEVLEMTKKELKENEKRISLEVLGAAGLCGFVSVFRPQLALIYFVFLIFMIFLYRYFRNIQDELMVEEVAVEDLEGGEVLAEEEELGGKIEGITEEDIESIEKEKVTIREGIRFVPVFPVAVILVDIIGFRLTWLFMFSL